MAVTIIILFAAYCAFLLSLLKGWQKVIRAKLSGSRSRSQLFTVIIPARNEAARIGGLLDDIAAQQHDNFEVIVVDDHSDDDTARVVQEKAGSTAYPLKIVRPQKSGKKNALSAGIAEAKGSIIITTDADCRVGGQWILGMSRCFCERSVKFVSGGVRIRGDGSVWSGLQATEFVSLIGTGAATIGLGYPTLCNGANMAFRRDVFNEVGGYAGNEHIASGDDEFLIRKVHSSYPGGVRFCSDAATVVETTAVPFGEFISQRLRWAGKWKQHRSFPGPALAVFIFSFHAAFLMILPAVVIAGEVIIPLVLIAGKMLLEYMLLRRVSAFLGTGWSWTRFGVLQVTYPLYAVLFGIFANLKSPVWKGRKIKTQRHRNTRAIGSEPLNLPHV